MDTSNFWWQSAGDGPGPGPDPGDPIGQSLRFRGGQHLERTHTTTGNRSTFTISFWVKNSKLETHKYWATSHNDGSDSGNYTVIHENGDGFNVGAFTKSAFTAPGKYRDVSAWYHIVVSQDNGEGHMYINGAEVFDAAADWQTTTSWNAACLHRIGRNSFNTNFPGHGYLAAFYNIDGQALLPTAFGRYNTEGVWVPDDYDGTYGINGFHLTFDPTQDPDPAVAIGMDSSGNDNHFTSSGFEVGNQSSPDYDLMQDSPTQNFATLNPLDAFWALTAGSTPQKANLEARSAFNSRISIRLPVDSGTYYWEGRVEAWGNLSNGMGIIGGPSASALQENNGYGWYHTNNGSIRWVVDGTFENTFTTPALPAVFGFQYDSTNHTLAVSQDGTVLRTFTGIPEIDYYIRTWADSADSDPAIYQWNFGQQPFLYRPATLTDANNVQTQNLPEVTITDGRDHFRALTGPGSVGGQCYNEGNIGIEDPVVLTTPIPPNTSNQDSTRSLVVDLFDEVTTVDITWNSTSTPENTILLSIDGINWRNIGAANITAGVSVTYADGAPFRYVRQWRSTGKGNGIRAASGLNILGQAQNAFPQGLWWIKSRVSDGNTNQHQLVDSVRGGNIASTCPGGGSTGSADTAYVAPAGNSVAWCWNLGTATAETNTLGDLESQVTANVEAGFSICQYVGNQTPNVSFGHGLGTKPGFVLIKNNSIAQPITALHDGTGSLKYTFLNMASVMGDSGETIWDENLIYVSKSEAANGPSHNMTAYVWSARPGYSAFGSYTGNANASGPMIWTGFRPAFVMFKRIDATTNWEIFDTTRSLANPLDTPLYASQEWKEPVPDPLTSIDFLSNGFKQRNPQSNSNQGTLIYAAFAENPFGGSNVSPANAR